MKVQIDLDMLDDYMIEEIAGIGEESINENLEWLVMLAFGESYLYFPKLHGVLRYVKSLLPAFSDETLSYLKSKARLRTDELSLIKIQDGVALWRAFKKDIEREQKRRRKMRGIGLK